MPSDSDAKRVAIVGGGIVGLASALALIRRGMRSVMLLEAETEVARHQTGHNSGVIHSGLYYKPGSLKALNCARGRRLMYRFCAEHGIPHERCGKIVVATSPREKEQLTELERRGKENGLTSVRTMTREELREREPHVEGVAGLLVEETGIVDFKQVAATMARLIREAGGVIHTNARVNRIHTQTRALAIETGERTFTCQYLINCAGLHSDRIARLCGLKPACRIVPFRGEYYKLSTQAESLVRHLIYPVPDPRFPFLGVHFTRMIGGGVEAGPNAVLALKREGYTWGDVSMRDINDMLGFPGFWRMVGRYGRVGCHEAWRSLSKQAFVRALQKLVPAIRPQDVTPHGAGVRAQAVGRDGALLDDFYIMDAPRMVHVLNAPSPAATASLSIGETVADRLFKHLHDDEQP